MVTGTPGITELSHVRNLLPPHERIKRQGMNGSAAAGEPYADADATLDLVGTLV